VTEHFFDGPFLGCITEEGLFIRKTAQCCSYFLDLLWECDKDIFASDSVLDIAVIEFVVFTGRRGMMVFIMSPVF
jgi:hypothetical protein